jgi:AcrR family transcriptional regulator
LLDERGYRSMTVDDIAALAGVGKQTIYRRWPSKAAIVLDALTMRTAFEIVAPDRGSAREDVRLFLRDAFAALRSGRRKVVVTLMAEAQLDEEFAAAFRERFIAGRRAALIELLARGVRRGELAPDADVEFLADMIHGPIWYRLLNRHAPVDDEFADTSTAFVFARARRPSQPEKRRNTK